MRLQFMALLPALALAASAYAQTTTGAGTGGSMSGSGSVGSGGGTSSTGIYPGGGALGGSGNDTFDSAGELQTESLGRSPADSYDNYNESNRIQTPGELDDDRFDRGGTLDDRSQLPGPTGGVFRNPGSPSFPGPGPGATDGMSTGTGSGGPGAGSAGVGTEETTR